MKEEWNPNYMSKDLKTIEKMKTLKGSYLFYSTQNASLKMDEHIVSWEAKG